MTLKIRRSGERGFADRGWLKSYHTFSFADYHDPAHMGFRSLRVINEDYIAGGMGFGSHPHKDMEIITYVLDGTLAHKDSMGNQENINAGDIQKMSAGTGVTHSEFNADHRKAVHLFQIWILPDKQGVAPAYQQITLQRSFKDGLLLIADNGKAPGTIFLQQDVKVFIGCFKAGASYSYSIRPKRGVWLQMIAGHIGLNGQEFKDSDAAALDNGSALDIKMHKDTEFILFDLA